METGIDGALNRPALKGFPAIMRTFFVKLATRREEAMIEFGKTPLLTMPSPLHLGAAWRRVRGWYFHQRLGFGWTSENHLSFKSVAELSYEDK